MTRRWSHHLGAGLLGCAIAALLLAPALRGFLSPWSALADDAIVMFAADTCRTSRLSLASVAADPRLAFIVPVPAHGPDTPSPQVCAAALARLGETHARVRWLPEPLACRWLAEDAAAVMPADGVSTPSWYAAGELVDDAGSATEAALFAARGWRIEWTPGGLRLSRLDEPRPETQPWPLPIRRIEDMGLSSYRDDRW